MEKLVSKNFLGQDMEFYGCKSCAISNHEITNIIGDYIYDDGFVNVIADPEVPIKGFLVVGIKPHVAKLTELSKDERSHIFEVVNKIEVCMSSLGEDSVLKFEDGYGSHWRQWILPANYEYYYNPQIYESDEKSKSKCSLYYSRFCSLLLKLFIDSCKSKEELDFIKDAIIVNSSIEDIIVVLRDVLGDRLDDVLKQLKEYNWNFGRGKNLKNITNYAKMFTSDDEKEEVVDFARKMKKKYDELY